MLIYLIKQLSVLKLWYVVNMQWYRGTNWIVAGIKRGCDRRNPMTASVFNWTPVEKRFPDLACFTHQRVNILYFDPERALLNTVKRDLLVSGRRWLTAIQMQFGYRAIDRSIIRVVVTHLSIIMRSPPSPKPRPFSFVSGPRYRARAAGDNRISDMTSFCRYSDDVTNDVTASWRTELLVNGLHDFIDVEKRAPWLSGKSYAL